MMGSERHSEVDGAVKYWRDHMATERNQVLFGYEGVSVNVIRLAEASYRIADELTSVGSGMFNVVQQC